LKTRFQKHKEKQRPK